MNKYNKTTNFLRKPVVSTPLNSFAFSERQLKRSMDAYELCSMGGQECLSLTNHRRDKTLQ